MASLTTELAEILHTVQRPGDFYTTGTIDIFAPRLEVAGVGPIALPLLPVRPSSHRRRRAGSLRPGRTLIDTEVRRTWQMTPSGSRSAAAHGSRPWRTSWCGRPPASG